MSSCVSVDSSGATHRYVCETILAKHLQVLGHSGLADTEIPPDDFDDLARGMFASSGDFQDSSPDGVGKNIKCMHYEPV